MVKVTIVGRMSDGLPLAQGLRYMNEEYAYLSCYRQQAEFILPEISRGALIASKMTIHVHNFCFNYLVENGVVFIVLSESTYPRKLAFHYLQDIQKEFEKFDKTLIGKITRPYSFVKFDGIIANISRQYIDTRTQANLSKLNANRKQDVDVASQDFYDIVQRKRNSETMRRLPVTPQPESTIWCSPRLEAIALKWTPIMILVFTSMALLWASLVLTDDFIISSWNLKKWSTGIKYECNIDVAENIKTWTGPFGSTYSRKHRERERSKLKKKISDLSEFLLSTLKVKYFLLNEPVL